MPTSISEAFSLTLPLLIVILGLYFQKYLDGVYFSVMGFIVFAAGSYLYFEGGRILFDRTSHKEHL